MTPKKKLVYQVFSLLKTHVSDPSCKTLDVCYVMSIEKQLTVELKMDVLERSMKGSPATSADKLLSSLSTTYQESIDKNGGVDDVEKLDNGNLDGLDVDQSSNSVDKDAAQSSGKIQSTPTKITKKR